MFTKLKEKINHGMQGIKKLVILGAVGLFLTFWIIIALLIMIVVKLY